MTSEKKDKMSKEANQNNLNNILPSKSCELQNNSSERSVLKSPCDKDHEHKGHNCESPQKSSIYFKKALHTAYDMGSNFLKQLTIEILVFLALHRTLTYFFKY